MALELTYASDATLLLDDLVDSLGRPGSAAGVVVPVLMPSLPLVDRTKAALARRHGVAMGVAFLLPGSFIEHMAQLVGLDPVHPSWRPQGALLHESSLARTMPIDKILTGRCDTTLVGRGRSSD